MAAALIELVVPGEESGATRRVLRLLVVLSVLTLILAPLLSALTEVSPEELGHTLVGESGDRASFEEIFSEALERGGAADLSAGIERLLADEFHIAAEDISVTVSLSETGEVSGVAVRLSGTALLVDPAQIEARLRELLSCKIEVR